MWEDYNHKLAQYKGTDGTVNKVQCQTNVFNKNVAIIKKTDLCMCILKCKLNLFINDHFKQLHKNYHITGQKKL